MEKRLFVGNLSYRTSKESLGELFAGAGRVQDVAIITDRDSGQSKGFGFVEMATPEDAQKAISMFNGYNLDGREIKVSEAQPREERSRSGGGRNGGYGGGGGYSGGGGGGGRGGGRRGGRGGRDRDYDRDY